MGALASVHGLALGLGMLLLVLSARAVPGLVRGVRRYRRVTHRLEAAERREELRWLCVRLRLQGYLGDDLHEMLCRASNCTPAEAAHAIVVTEAGWV